MSEKNVAPPTVQDLFHPSFPAIPWPIRDDHEFQKYVPIKTDYTFRSDITADYLGWHQFGGQSCLISGPTGSGKSSLVNEVAARSNIPVFPVVGHNRLEWLDLVGQYNPQCRWRVRIRIRPASAGHEIRGHPAI